MAADGDAAHAEVLDGVVNLLHREIGELQSGGGESHETIGMQPDPFGEAVIVDADDFGGEVAIGGVPPECIDIERLNIDAAFVEFRDTLRP